MKFKRLRKESLSHVDEATEGEAMVTEDIFDALSKIAGYVVDFADNGYEISLTDQVDGLRYTITIKQDE